MVFRSRRSPRSRPSPGLCWSVSQRCVCESSRPTPLRKVECECESRVVDRVLRRERRVIFPKECVPCRLRRRDCPLSASVSVSVSVSGSCSLRSGPFAEPKRACARLLAEMGGRREEFFGSAAAAQVEITRIATVPTLPKPAIRLAHHHTAHSSGA